MPAIYFHFITYDLLLDKKNPYRNVALLGAQGADPLFYYGRALSLRANSHENRAMGNKFHHDKIADTISAMMEYASRRENEVERNILFAYIDGYIFHYCIDRNCHPYIFYRSGFESSKDENKLKYSYFHCLFESSLDMEMAKRYKLKRINPKYLLKCSNKSLMLISQMYYFVTQKVYYPCNYFTRRTFYRAVKGMRFVYGFTYSRFSLKKKILSKHFKYSMANAISHPLKVDPTVDFLNLNHNTWRDPVTGMYNETSVIDMVENAKREFETTRTFKEIKDKTVRDSYILRLVHDTNFDGDRIGLQKKYYSLFMEDYKK